MEVLAVHSSNMFSQLIYDSDVLSTNKKVVDFGHQQGPLKGFFAKKGRTKYWLDEVLINCLPLKPGKEFEELEYNENEVKRPTKPIPFKIIPEQRYDHREFIDQFVPFKHTNSDHWFIAKVISIMGFVGRVYVCISSPSEFGKSSIFDIMHYLTDKSPVFKPRSIPGVLNQITGNGNLVLDETHRCKKEVRDIIEEFALQIAGGKSVYINGALKSGQTKDRYECNLQSMVFLYNDVSNYNNVKDYFEYIFSNNKAIDTRFLKVKLEGKLKEVFDSEFDIPQSAADNKMEYICIAKHLLWLQELKRKNGYVRRFEAKSKLNLRGRKLVQYAELTWLIDMYAKNQGDMNRWVKVLDGCIIGYTEMVDSIEDVKVDNIVEEEVI